MTKSLDLKKTDISSKKANLLFTTVYMLVILMLMIICIKIISTNSRRGWQVLWTRELEFEYMALNMSPTISVQSVLVLSSVQHLFKCEFY